MAENNDVYYLLQVFDWHDSVVHSWKEGETKQNIFKVPINEKVSVNFSVILHVE